jgi:hypothetical protein
MTEVLVTTKEQWSEVSGQFIESAWTRDKVRAAMTAIDIPDGCKLAVVDTKKGVDFNTEGESYVLLVQEVM